jgi:hypothetical protein
VSIGTEVEDAAMAERMKLEAQIPVAVVADGGVMGVNPSPLGGTWAFCYLDAEGRRFHERSGILTPEAIGLPAVSNNVVEFYAIARALWGLPDGWSGRVFSDSQNALIRWFRNAAMNGMPAQWMEGRRHHVRRLGEVSYTLLAGHPTREDLEGRFSKKRGLPVHPENVWCDLECIRQAMEYGRELGLEHCERVLGKPYTRLRDHLERLAKAAMNGHEDLEPMDALDAMAAIDENFDAEIAAADEASAAASGREIAPQPTEADATAGQPAEEEQASRDWHICIDPHGHRFFYHFPEPIGPRVGNIWVEIELDEAERELLGSPVTGEGGFQNLVRYLQAQCLIDEGRRLRMVKRTAHRVVRTSRGKSGNFQGKLARVGELAAQQLGTYKPELDPEEAKAALDGLGLEGDAPA